MVSFASTICLASPAAGAERDDNSFTTSNLPNPAEILWAQSALEQPDRDYLMQDPQGMWSGKAVTSEHDFRHVAGIGGQSWPTPQDMTALRQLGPKFADFAAHLPNLRTAEERYTGKEAAWPYLRGGSSMAGRESEKMVDLHARYRHLHNRGVTDDHIPHLASRIVATDKRIERQNQQRQVLAAMHHKRDCCGEDELSGATDRFKWQTSIVPGHPLHTASDHIVYAR